MLLPLNKEYLRETLLRLLCIHSPTGYTDPVVREVCQELDALGIPYELTHRGAIRATLRGKAYSPNRAVVTHLDTLGAMVKEIKPNGRLALVPVGTWSARFAEGARVSIFCDNAIYRGTILPIKASGHVYDSEIDRMPASWENVELRIDEFTPDAESVAALGVHIGDFVGVDSNPETLASGYINARHLDNKAGVAAVLTAARALLQNKTVLPVDCHLLFTISEEVGSGASAVLHGDVSEMVTVDNGTVAPGQASKEYGVTVAMADSSGPFDYHLTHHLLHLCRHKHISHQRDIFKYYRCDSAAAVEAGNDIRTALITFGLDASHGYERTHMDSLLSVSQLIACYAQSELLQKTERQMMQGLEDFPQTRTVDVELERVPQRESVAQIPMEPEDLPAARP